MSRRVGAYPGSFNPPTVAHLAVAESAVRHAGLARVDLVVSRRALAKEDLVIPTLDDRLALLREIAATRPWLGVALTDARLIVDIARGYDAVIMGADKWRQVNDPAWYPDGTPGRDRAVAELPQVLVAARAGDAPDGVELLPVDASLHQVSASAVRDGHDRAGAWALPEAVAFDERTGAWSDPDRYRRARVPGSGGSTATGSSGEPTAPGG